jgi:ubiquinone/menaquinone biosynthesis C-methylase UbiE
MRRVPCEELLDYDRGSPEEVAGNLDDLWAINRWLGGISTWRALLDAFFARAGRHPVRILEVGAGDARLACRLRFELAQRGITARFVVLDRRITHLLHGQVPADGLQPIVADALALPFPERSFDVAMCNLVFHHFSGPAAVAFLHALGRVAREAVLINDLERHWLPYAFIRLVPGFTSNRMSRHDAAASVRQAYTRQELAALAREAGFQDFEVRRFLLFRLGLILWKSHAGMGKG